MSRLLFPFTEHWFSWFCSLYSFSCCRYSGVSLSFLTNFLLYSRCSSHVISLELSFLLASYYSMSSFFKPRSAWSRRGMKGEDRELRVGQSGKIQGRWRRGGKEGICACELGEVETHSFISRQMTTRSFQPNEIMHHTELQIFSSQRFGGCSVNVQKPEVSVL